MAAIVAPERWRDRPLADHDWRRSVRLLRIREQVYLMQDGDRSPLDAAIREDGAELEHVYVVDAWSRWVSGELNEQTIQRPENGSKSVAGALDALLALAAGDTAIG